MPAPTRSFSLLPTWRSWLCVTLACYLVLSNTAAAAIPEGIYEIRPENSALCLDVDTRQGAMMPGAGVNQWHCNGERQQRWKVVRVADGFYKLLAQQSQMALDVSGGSQNDGARLQQWNDLGNTAQTFAIEAVGGDRYRIVNRRSGKVVDVSGKSREAGAPLIQWRWLNSANQKFQFIRKDTPGPVVGPENPPPATPSGWKMVWNDEFNGSQIDRSKWELAVDGKGGGNNELQYYTNRPANAFVKDGKLVIQALRERYSGADGTRDFTSARLSTPNKGDWTYGRVEVRARMPAGQGMWPAIWMLPTDWVYGGWAASGEIDIMEAVNLGAAGGNEVHGTIHYGGKWPNNTHKGKSVTPASSVSENFHVYAIEWEEGEIRWYVNDRLYATQTEWYSEAASYPAPFNQRFHLILNVAVGGQWPGSPNSGTRFPQTMEVDYVRVYERNAGGGGDGGSDPCSSKPFSGAATVLPGRLEAENYDKGCSGLAYSDSDAGNSGGAFRKDAVDLEVARDTGGGYNLGWTDSGEWLNYTVKVEESGRYDLQFRVASAGGAGRVAIDIGNREITSATFPATGGWQTWRTVTVSGVELDAGEQTLTLRIEAGNFNLNYVDFQPAGSTPAGPFTVNKARGEWTLVVIPDTQHYSQNRANAPIAHMRKAFDWIVNIKSQLNIKFVQGLGDITESWNNRWEWDNSTSAWDKLYGQVPFMPIIGNHDDPGMMNQYFPVSSFSRESWYGGDFGGIENNYALMDIGQESYMFLQVETYDQYSQYRPAGMNWAKSILAAYPDRKVILATHDTWATRHIRDNLLTRFDNIVLSNAGHVCQREAYYTTNGPRGGVAHNFITDYQCDAQEVMRLRYYVFKPLEDKVDYFTYSPVTGEFEVDASSQGSFRLIQANP
ncbi:MAG: hypothetical protein CME36_15970 [unclassified Hahellaceae]|nr:hypothetical protein [Hahellaceae bacterium]